MKKSLHSSPRSTPAPLAFLSAVPAPTCSAGTSPSPSRGQQLLLTVAKIQHSPPQTTLAQERCHGLQARQLRCSHVFPGPTERHQLHMPGYNYKDGNNLPGQPHQTHHQKSLVHPQALESSSRAEELRGG